MLPELERQFKAYVADADEAFAQTVRDSAKADRKTLLGVYRDAYVWRLHECLGNDYPGLRAMLGEKEFLVAARVYVATHPSRHANVRWFGQHMADFIGPWVPVAISEGAKSMARFEWALGEAQDAADAAALSFADLAGLPAEAWSRVKFQFHPSVRRLTLHAQAPQAWLKREEIPAGPLHVELEHGPVEWLIWRQDLDVQFRSMDKDEAVAFDAAQGGGDFPAICAALDGLIHEEEIPARAAGLLRAWVEAGLVTGQSH